MDPEYAGKKECNLFPSTPPNNDIWINKFYGIAPWILWPNLGYFQLLVFPFSALQKESWTVIHLKDF